MVRIVTDSSSDLPASILNELGIYVLSASIMFGREKYVDGKDITTKEFYDKLSSDYFFPLTAPSSPLDFFKVFSEIEETGEDILVVTLPESLSGFQRSARLGAEFISEVDIQIYNSGGVSGFQGLLAIQAARLAKNGYSTDEIIRNLDELKKRAKFFAVVPSTDSLIRGGRVPVATGKIAALLGLYPILTVQDDGLISFAAKRGFDKSFETIMVELQTFYSKEEPLICIILDSYNSQEAYKLEKRIRDEFNIKELLFSRVGATIGANAGEGAVAVAMTPYLSDF